MKLHHDIQNIMRNYWLVEVKILKPELEQWVGIWEWNQQSITRAVNVSYKENIFWNLILWNRVPYMM